MDINTNKQVAKKKKTLSVPLGIIFLLGALLTASYKISVNLFYITILVMLLSILLLFALATSNNFLKKTLCSLAVVGFLPLILFPSIYTLLLYINPKSFIFDNEIIQYETEEQTVSTINKYQPSKISNDSLLLSAILKTNNGMLDENVTYLIEGNVAIIENLIISTKSEQRIGMDRPDPTAYLTICDASGKLLTCLYKGYEAVDRYDNKSIRTILNDFLFAARHKTLEFNSEIKNIKEGKIWEFFNVMIRFLTSGGKPLTRSAEIARGVHVLIESVFALAALGFYYKEYLSRKEKRVF